MKRYDNEVVLLYGDTHFPYHDINTISFIRGIQELYRPDRIIHMGDVLDMYSVSSYPKDLNHPDSWTDELKKARACVSELADIFPEQIILSSNHDDRAYRKSVIAGVPREFLVPYMQVIGAPKGWKLQNELRFTIDSTREKWLLSHTLAGGSMKAALSAGCSVALGHSHTKFGAEACKVGKKVHWALDTGCLISDSGSPFKYNKINIAKPIRGCVILIGGVPQFQRMY